MKNAVIALLALFLIYSCTAIPKSGVMQSAQESLAGSSWRLADKVSGKAPTIMFEEGKVSGNSGCNNFFGEVQYSQSNGSVKFNQMGSTRMMCGAAEMETESAFLTVLPKVNRYNVNGSTLEFYQDKLLLLKFTKN